MRDALRAEIKTIIEDNDKPLNISLDRDEDYLLLPTRQIIGQAKTYIDRYGKSIVGYDFAFDIKENNNADASIDLLHTFSGGTLGLKLGGHNNLERNSIEQFRVLDSFWGLATGVGDDYCDAQNRGLKIHWEYPITGHLNLINYVEKFLDFNQSGNLAPKEGGGEISTYSVTLKFTTELEGKIGSTLTVPTKKRNFELTGASANLEGTRKDEHKVTLVFLLPKGDIKSKTIAEERVQQELDYLRERDDVRSIGIDR